MTLMYQVGCIPGYGMPRMDKPSPTLTGKDLVREIARQVAEKHGVNPDVMFVRRLRNKAGIARQEMAWRLRRMTKPTGEPRFSIPQIGRLMGGLHHTTVLHAIRAHEKRMGGAQ